MYNMGCSFLFLIFIVFTLIGATTHSESAMIGMGITAIIGVLWVIIWNNAKKKISFLSNTSIIPDENHFMFTFPEPGNKLGVQDAAKLFSTHIFKTSLACNDKILSYYKVHSQSETTRKDYWQATCLLQSYLYFLTFVIIQECLPKSLVDILMKIITEHLMGTNVVLGAGEKVLTKVITNDSNFGLFFAAGKSILDDEQYRSAGTSFIESFKEYSTNYQTATKDMSNIENMSEILGV